VAAESKRGVRSNDRKAPKSKERSTEGRIKWRQGKKTDERKDGGKEVRSIG